MWPMGFISLSSSIRKAGETKKTDKKPTKVSKTNIRLSPVTRNHDLKFQTAGKPNIIKKRLNFYENKETEDSRRKQELQAFAQFATSQWIPKIADPQMHISRSLSYEKESDPIRSQRNVPVFKSSSQFKKYFSESERESSTLPGLDLDGDFIPQEDVTRLQTSQELHLSPYQTLSDCGALVLPTSPQVKRVQFTPTLPTISHNKVQQKSYPIPQIDNTVNMIPPRPKSATKKEIKKDDDANSSSKDTRSNSLPASCQTELQPIRTSFRNSKKVVLANENSEPKEKENVCISPTELLVLKSGRRQKSISETENDDLCPDLLISPEPDIEYFNENRNHSKATALFDFRAHYSNELSFNRGDCLNLIRKIDGHWYEAEMNGRRGLVPFNYLEVKKQSEKSISEPGEAAGIMLKDFRAQYPSEISAKKNEIVNIIRHLRGDWMEVRISSKTGLIPAHYVSSYMSQH